MAAGSERAARLYASRQAGGERAHTWINHAMSKARLFGPAADDTESGVLVRVYNAG